MRSVRISAKHARAIVSDAPHPLLDAALDAIRRQIASRPIPSARKKTKAKKAARAEETGILRDQVMLRDHGLCVICGRTDAQSGGLHMDHFFGRGREPQTLQTCWMLCWYDHASKTRNSPTAAWWLERFANHCREHGYSREEKKARARLDSLNLISEAERMNKP